MYVDSPDSQFLVRGLFVSYMIYYATGEGVRVCVAVAGSTHHAESILRGKIDKYFHALIKSAPVEINMAEEVAQVMNWIPQAVQFTLGQIPVGVGDYYAEFYYNLG